jgi:hypothetical protein
VSGIVVAGAGLRRIAYFSSSDAHVTAVGGANGSRAHVVERVIEDSGVAASIGRAGVPLPWPARWGYPGSMTEIADQFEDRDRGEDVERPRGNEGITEDAEPPREGESVEGHGP